jgi:hypothetical protein
MPTEVRSPISRKGSAVGSGPPMSPGSRANPSARRDSVPEQEHQTTGPVGAHNEPPAPPLQERQQGAGKEPERGLAVEE